MRTFTATITKTKEGQPAGEYVHTAVDDQKDAAEFLLVQVGHPLGGRPPGDGQGAEVAQAAGRPHLGNGLLREDPDND